MGYGPCRNCGRNIPDANHLVRGSGFMARNDPRIAYCSRKCRDEFEAREAGKKDEDYESGGGSSSSGSGSGVLGNVIAGIVLVLLLIIVIGIIFGKNEDANDPVVIMEKWEEHLEKRRAAFAEGLPEEGVEARGLKNYTWEEWQALKQKGKEKSGEKESHEAKSMADLWSEHQAKRMELLNQGVSSDTVEKMGYGAMTLDEFRARFGDDPEAKLRRLNARLAELERGGKTDVRQSSVTSTVVPKVPAPTPKTSAAPATSKEPVVPVAPPKTPAVPVPAPKPSVVPVPAPKPSVVPDPVAPPKPSVAPVPAQQQAITSEDGNAVGEQKNTGKKASKDSKAIRITVQGKGKTKEAAVRWALRDAVWKTVGTWVDSKSRIQENRDEVVAQVKTITEADVPKFEVIDTQEQNGGFVVKVRVSVSKKKIAPKFAKVFPDVFTIE